MVRITANEKSLLFTFTNSNHYFQNGTVEVPKNSLALIVDDSDMASFKKSASNDIFISASYTELGMTKSELISWFEENGFSEVGGGGLTPEEAQEMINESISGKTDLSAFTSYSASVDTALSNKADVSSLTAYFDGAEYDSNTKRINFYNGNVVKAYIDATAFIKDGMVDTVTISGSNLVISFNTDAGKEDITIPLTDIFNPNNYYDKTATNALLANKLDISAFTAYSASVDTALSGKASQSDLNTLSGDIIDIQTALQGKANASDLQALEVVVGTKANATDLDSLANVVNGKASQTDLNTLSGNVDTLSGQLADKADTTAMTTALADKLDVSDFNTYSSATQTAINGKASQTDLETVSGNVDTISGDVETINLALADKADTTAVTEAISEAVSGKTDLSAFTAFTSSTETALNGKLAINDFNTYSGGVDTELSNKADASALADKVDLTAYTAYTAATETTINGKASQTDLNAVSGNVDTLSGQVADKADTTAMTTALADKLDISTFETYSGSVDTALSGKASQTDLNTVSGNVDTLSGDMANKVDVSAYTAYTSATDTALQGKADTSDLANYVEVTAYTAYTSSTETTINGKASQTDLNAVSGSVANKQDLLVSGTNIKTINNTSLLGSGNIDVQVSVDSALDSGSTNAVANSAITKAIQDNELVVANALITLQTALSGYSLWKGTQTQYDDIVTKNEDTIYFIVNNS